MFVTAWTIFPFYVLILIFTSVMKDIPVHQLEKRGSIGMDIWRYQVGDIKMSTLDEEIMKAHRDDHYIFFVVEAGDTALMIDFNEIRFAPNSLYYILPGQVHHGLSDERAAGWFMAVDTMLVPPDYRKVFEGQLALQKPYPLADVQMKQCMAVLDLLLQRFSNHEKSTFNTSVVHSLLQSFIGIAAGCYFENNDMDVRVSRPVEISRLFKQLLIENYISIKSPSVYARMLNVSESYLNEVLKKVTGFSVTYWILNEVMLEAKRLLYYSECNVKEVAHTLGYNDHAYFSRLFKKTEGISPLTFRADYRK
jgi:AraC family transcriptional activator of pobA